jgi:hypothetical protein
MAEAAGKIGFGNLVQDKFGQNDPKNTAGRFKTIL